MLPLPQLLARTQGSFAAHMLMPAFLSCVLAVPLTRNLNCALHHRNKRCCILLEWFWYCNRRRTVAARVHHIFQSLGLRHLAVVEPRGFVVGIITRKDLGLASHSGVFFKAGVWPCTAYDSLCLSVCLSVSSLKGNPVCSFCQSTYVSA